MARPKASEPSVQVTLHVPLSVYEAIAARAVAKRLTWHRFVVGCLVQTFKRLKTPPASADVVNTVV